jgi:hypothetical protein
MQLLITGNNFAVSIRLAAQCLQFAGCQTQCLMRLDRAASCQRCAGCCGQCWCIFSRSIRSAADASHAAASISAITVGRNNCFVFKARVIFSPVFLVDIVEPAGSRSGENEPQRTNGMVSFPTRDRDTVCSLTHSLMDSPHRCDETEVNQTKLNSETDLLFCEK